jgi:hypothetical protein
MITSTHNQPLTTSKNHQDSKDLQKLQLDLIFLAPPLDPLLSPLITLPNRLKPHDLFKRTSQIQDLQTQAQLSQSCTTPSIAYYSAADIFHNADKTNLSN